LHVPEGGHEKITHNTPYRAGKGFLYEGGVRIPLIVRGPGIVPARVTATPVMNTDWLPTLLELAGAPAPTGLDGKSFARLLRGDPVEPRALFWHFPHYTNQGSRPGGAVREGDWKLIEHYDTGSAELYDLKNDVSETTDLAEREPARVGTLKAKLAAWRLSVGAQTNSLNPSFTPALYKSLYEDTDVSRHEPPKADAAMQKQVLAWRKQMNAVVPREGRPNALQPPQSRPSVRQNSPEK
jgi:arylsulfatase A-like enzyme